MSIKGKLFLSQKVDLGYKSYEDSIHPATTIAETEYQQIYLNETQFITFNSKYLLMRLKMKKGRNIKIIKLDPKYEDDKKDKGQFLAVRNKNRQRVVIKQRKQERDDSFSDDVPSIKPQVLQQSQSQMSGMGQSRKTPKQPRGEFKILPRQDALVKLVEAKPRIETDKIDNIKQELKLPLHIRYTITRDGRIFESFDQLKEKWKSVNNQIVSNCERSPTETILIRSDNYREIEILNQILLNLGKMKMKKQ
ncbi:unnamed protein product [Paramecium primaurelia]|uniref:Uncharacterized protein n=1 Tax=Paramecium primaurelia TaxID=5886 RepID=A0A8S1N711_PARPR|nr:unnamed protein product [Paramecium primaurelia]